MDTIIKIAQKGYRRIGFVIEKYADDYEDGKFVGGYLKAEFDINNKMLIPAYYWDNNYRYPYRYSACKQSKKPIYKNI